VPGVIPSEVRNSEGITSCPFVLTVVILFIMSYILSQVRQTSLLY
jgi:hypothetical protein